jgi:2-hydroxy fatty acid dioxygenase
MPCREDLRSEYQAYAAFHRHPTNVRLHFLGVPLIHLTALILLSIYVHCAAPLVCACLYCIYYSLLDVDAALTCLPYQVAITALSTVTSQTADKSLVVKVAVSLHVLSWAMQVYGHKVYEGKSPAILQSLIGSIMTAPLFVVLEMSWTFGLALDLKVKLA